MQAYAAGYRAAQKHLVTALVSEAPTIVLAKALRWVDRNGRETEFEVGEVLKGSPTPSSRTRYQSSQSVGDTGCGTAGATLRNTAVLPGYQYLLYASGNRLLRARAEPYGRGLSFTEEVALVRSVLASNPSLERTRDR
jgi:hypothetical protein